MNHIFLIVLILFLSACSTKDVEIAQHLADGNQNLKNGHPEKALVEFRDALKIDDKNLEALSGLMSAYEKTSNYINMLKTGRQIIALYPDHVKTHIKLANLFLTASMREDAEKEILILETLTKDKEDPEVFALRASLQLSKRKTSEAFEFAQQALKLDAKNAAAYIVLAKISVDANDLSKALDYVNAAIVNNPDDTNLYLAKVSLLEQLHENQEVGNSLIKLVTLNPTNVDLKKRLIKFYVDSKAYVEAIGLVKELIKINPHDIDVQLTLVQLVLVNSGADKAIKQIDALIQDYPESLEFKLAEYALLKEYSDYQKAQATIEKIISNSSDIAQRSKAISVYANDLIDLGFKKQGAELINQVLHEDKGNTDALLVKGKLHIMENELSSAIIIYRGLLDDYPNSIPVLEALAKCYEFSGAIDLANQFYYDRFKIEPTNKDARTKYIQFLTKYDKQQLVRKILSELAAKYPNDLALTQEYASFEIAQNNTKKVREITDKLFQNTHVAWLAYKIKADELIAQKKYIDAIDSLKSGLRSTDDEVGLSESIVDTYILLGDKKEAIKFASSRASQLPGNYSMEVLLAKTYAKFELNSAVTVYKRLIEADPAKLEAYLGLSRIYQQHRKYDLAESLLLQALGKNVANKELQFELANVYFFDRKFESALKLYSDLVQRYPNEVAIKSNFALLLLDHRSDKASHERAYALTQTIGVSDMPEVVDIMGWAAFKVGKLSRSIQLLESAVKADSSNGLINFHLAKAYAALPSYNKAMQAYLQAKTQFDQSDKTDYTSADLIQLKQEISAIGSVRK